MGRFGDPDEALVERVRPICLALPDADEEHAWAGTRWMVRKKTFAHVVELEDLGPATVVTFRAKGEELEMLMHAGPPYFYAGWGRNVVGLVLDDATDWEEVAELLTESYCVLAPQKLVALVERPPEPGE